MAKNKIAEICGINSPDDLEALFPSYGITRTGNDAVDYRNLALRLVQEGYSPSAPLRGARTRSPFALTALHVTVESVKSQRAAAGRRCTDSMAISILAKDPRLNAIWLRHRSVRTLQNWLVEARDPKSNPLLAKLQDLNPNLFTCETSAKILKVLVSLYEFSRYFHVYSFVIESFSNQALKSKNSKNLSPEERAKCSEVRAKILSILRDVPLHETRISAFDRQFTDLFLRVFLELKERLPQQVDAEMVEERAFTKSKS